MDQYCKSVTGIEVTHALGVGLLTMLFHINANLFILFADPEAQTKAPQNASDHERAKGSQAIGHQHSLQLTHHQAPAPLLSQHLGGRVGRDQFSTGKHAGQERPNRAAHAMHGKRVEGIIKTQPHLELH